jgi:geranylgeranyl pyrophosphate synthase
MANLIIATLDFFPQFCIVAILSSCLFDYLAPSKQHLLRKSRHLKIEDTLADVAQQVDQALSAWLAPASAPAELAQAMRYAVLGGGKRLRPCLVYLAAQACRPDRPVPPQWAPAAAAVELVHCYSLVHDDLPAMDDDVLRRGRPTLHVQYGEAMAILVGDALLTQAFAVLAEQVAPAELCRRLIAELARGAGGAGMIAGQVADMELCRVEAGQAGLEYIHARKTADLFAAAARMGGLCGGADEMHLAALGQFGADLGLAFQVQDDLLDLAASSAQLGKTPGKDAAAGKTTYPGLLGQERAAAVASELNQRAVSRLEIFGQAAQPLEALARRLTERKH